jgi:hypothetical protein
VRRAVLVLASLLLPAAAEAQYRRAPSDTLRYREASRAVSVMRTPAGTLNATSTHDARIAVAFAGGDTARAWYEALSLSTTVPQGTTTPDTRPALGRPFLLRFDARGDVDTRSVPTFPEDFPSDLAHQFNDFFVRLPTAPLRRGMEWADTVRREMRTPSGRTLRTVRAGRFRVRGDTLVRGTRAWIVETRMQNRVESTGPTQGVTLTSVMEGTEEGELLFSAARGVMLGRRRTGTLEGRVELTGGPEPVQVPHRLTYQSTIELQ